MEYFAWDRLFVWSPEYKQACNYLLFLFSCIFQFFNFNTQLWVLFYKKRDKRNINIPSIHLKTCNIVPWLFLRCFYYSPTFIRAVRKYSARAEIPPLNLFFICNFRIFPLEYYYIIVLSYVCPDDNHFWLFIISLCYLLWQHTRFLGNKFSVIYKIPSVSLSLSLSVRFVCLLLPSPPPPPPLSLLICLFPPMNGPFTAQQKRMALWSINGKCFIDCMFMSNN